MELLRLENLVQGIVTKRPSKFIKCPYVADIELQDGNPVLGHTSSLGCCGLADAGAIVLLGEIDKPKDNTKKKNKNKNGLSCSHTVYLSVDKISNQIIGIHPKLSEKIVESALKNNCLTILPNIISYHKETTIHVKDKINSRFDFTGIDENEIPFIMEVKNVPLADYEDVTSKERKNMNFSGRDVNSKVAYFPDGYRKKANDPISPRALKHIEELTLIKRECLDKVRCIMCYVIQRTDVNRFQPSVIDMDYRRAFKIAMDSGVEIITLVVEWNSHGECHFVRDDLPITPFDDIV